MIHAEIFGAAFYSFCHREKVGHREKGGRMRDLQVERSLTRRFATPSPGGRGSHTKHASKHENLVKNRVRPEFYRKLNRYLEASFEVRRFVALTKGLAITVARCALAVLSA